MSGVSLIGQGFHTFKDDNLHCQGVVIGNPEPGWYLVQLFEWAFGTSSHRQIVRIEDMSKWVFYEDAEQMKEAYNLKYSGVTK